MSSDTQNIVIVGAGFAGLNTFNFLHAKLSKLPDSRRPTLTLITPKPFFTHLPALLRTAVTSEGRLEDQILMSLTPPRFTDPHNKLIHASVTEVVDDDENGKGQRYVVLDTGARVEFSVLVVAPGSVWEGPLDFKGLNTKEEVVGRFEE